MSTDDGGAAHPRSMRQQRILDVAEENPTASITKLASMVSSATPQLVENVLERHGDPTTDGGVTVESVDDDSSSTDASTSDTNTETAVDTDTNTDTNADSNSNSNSNDSMPDDATPPDETAAIGETSETADSDDQTSPDEDSTSDSESADTHPTAESNLDLDAISDQQQELLEAIALDPDATQRELASQFNISTSTVCNRVNDIPEFEWRSREAFVDDVFDDPSSLDRSLNGASQPATDSKDSDGTVSTDGAKTLDDVDSDTESTDRDGQPSDNNPQSMTDDSASTGNDTAPTTSNTEIVEAVSNLTADIDALSSRIADVEARIANEESVLEDPDLVHKIVHACMESERISESEELRILKELLE